jgi:hypothetical protein
MFSDSDLFPSCAEPFAHTEPLRLLNPAIAASEPDAIGGEPCSPESLHFLEAWHHWRGDRLVPLRRDVELLSICKLMPQFLVLEVNGPDRATIRLAGTEVERQFGSTLTKRNLIALTDRPYQPQRGQRLWQMVNQPCAALLHLAIDRQSGQRNEVELAIAPVLPDDHRAACQLFIAVSRLPHWQWGSAADPVAHSLGRNLRFLDIGGGIPTLG